LRFLHMVCASENEPGPDGTLVEESSSGRGGRRGEAPSEEEGEGVRKDVGAAEGG
jgi:hypothetical protein